MYLFTNVATADHFQHTRKTSQQSQSGRLSKSRNKFSFVKVSVPVYVVYISKAWVIVIVHVEVILSSNQMQCYTSHSTSLVLVKKLAKAVLQPCWQRKASTKIYIFCYKYRLGIDKSLSTTIHRINICTSCWSNKEKTDLILSCMFGFYQHCRKYSLRKTCNQ